MKKRETERRRERETPPLPCGLKKKDDSFPLELALPSLDSNLSCRQEACQTQLTRLPHERCRKLDSLLVVGMRL